MSLITVARACLLSDRDRVARDHTSARTMTLFSLKASSHIADKMDFVFSTGNLTDDGRYSNIQALQQVAFCVTSNRFGSPISLSLCRLESVQRIFVQ